MNHIHRRDGDKGPETIVEKIDGFYKVGKILVMVCAVGAFVFAFRDRIAEIPKTVSRVEVLERETINIKEQMAYLVGGMEGLTGKKFRSANQRQAGF